LVNLVVAALGHAQMGFTTEPPPLARGRRPLSPVQTQHVQMVERLVSRWGRVEVGALDCGRKGTALRDMVGALADHAARVGSSPGPYQATGAKVRGLGPAGFLPVVASRYKFLANLGFFEAADHMNEYLWMPYVEPAVLRGIQPRTPTHRFPRKMCSFSELRKVFEVWAAAGRFATRSAAEVAAIEISQLASVFKSEEEDRQIIDERGPNGMGRTSSTKDPPDISCQGGCCLMSTSARRSS